MPEQLWLTAILNHLFAGRSPKCCGQSTLSHLSGSADPQRRVHAAFGILPFWCFCSPSSARNCRWNGPAGFQHVFESLHGFIQGQSEEMIGHGSAEFTPFLLVFMLFILSSNLLGLIPGFESPTAWRWFLWAAPSALSSITRSRDSNITVRPTSSISSVPSGGWQS